MGSAMPLHIGAIDDDRSISIRRSHGLHGRVAHAHNERSGGVPDWIKLDEVDILLVDYHMPVMNGLHLIRKARSSPRSWC